MRILFLAIISFISIHLSAQTPYHVIGFAGKDTVNIATVSPDKKGQVSFNLNSYSGAIRLIPATRDFQEISEHLDKIKQINSEATFNAAKAYVNDTLSFAALYHSGMWKEYIQQWVGFYAQSVKSADDFARLFVPVAKKVLERAGKENIQAGLALTNDLLEFFEQYGLQQAAENIAAYAMGVDTGTGSQNDIASRLYTAFKLIGKPAPTISNFSMKSCVILFHEIGCGSCDEQVSLFKTKCEELKAKGYTVVSVAGETNPDVYQAIANGLPWQDKIREAANMQGETFKVYGVVATPTIYVTDEKGIIQGRYAKLEETGLLNP